MVRPVHQRASSHSVRNNKKIDNAIKQAAILTVVSQRVSLYSSIFSSFLYFKAFQHSS